MVLGKLAGELEKLGISAGDRIAVSTPSGRVEGILIPSSGEVESEVLVVKLDNGYNVGLKAQGAKIEKLPQKQKAGLEKTPSRHLAAGAGLPKISLIATGGTIASRVDYKLGGVKSILSPQEIFYNAPELEKIASFEKISRPFTVWSENMTPLEWQKIAAETAKELNSGVEGVIVTHGTDTLHFTAAALSFMLKGLNRPVALVGAQRSPDRGSFDGAMNLACGAQFVAHSKMAEVAIVMHASESDDYCFAIRGTKARKMHASRRDAFRPVNDLPLAKVWPDGKIEKMQEARKAGGEGKVTADTKFEEKIAMLNAYPGAPPEMLDFLVEKKYRGVVVQATGLGQVPTSTLEKKFSWNASIKAAVESGMVVAFAPQTIYGSLSPFVYEAGRQLKALGVVHCGDMLAETAYVKLGWVLAHAKSRQEAARMMAENLAGEISQRHQLGEFLY